VIGEALTFHEMLGPERKEARLRYLRERWLSKIRDIDKFAFYTGTTPIDSCGITTVGIRGLVTADVQSWIYAKRGIYCISILTPGERTGDPPLIDGMRVTPNVYTTVSEADRFGDALVHAARNGITV
jgi:isopenicillin-N epimerase